MVDITITPGNVLAGADAKTETGKAGELLAAGKTVYKDVATGKFKLTDTNAATPPEIRKAYGIALNGASLDQPVVVQKAGQITIGATLVAGTAYYLSDTPGGICPAADVGTGESVCLLGLAASTTVLNVDIQFPGVQMP
jgi:hypothetical protein